MRRTAIREVSYGCREKIVRSRGLEGAGVIVVGGMDSFSAEMSMDIELKLPGVCNCSEKPGEWWVLMTGDGLKLHLAVCLFDSNHFSLRDRTIHGIWDGT